MSKRKAISETAKHNDRSTLTLKFIVFCAKLKTLNHKNSDTMDKRTKRQRSWNMSRVRGKDTTPEKMVRSFLHRRGFRFRLHVKNLPGHPDIVLPKYRTVIEVRGCFWHRHQGCKRATTPSSNTAFWDAKFIRNIERDKKNEILLNELGWRVIVVWECEIKQKDFLRDLANRIAEASQSE